MVAVALVDVVIVALAGFGRVADTLFMVLQIPMAGGTAIRQSARLPGLGWIARTRGGTSATALPLAMGSLGVGLAALLVAGLVTGALGTTLRGQGPVVLLGVLAIPITGVAAGLSIGLDASGRHVAANLRPFFLAGGILSGVLVGRLLGGFLLAGTVGAVLGLSAHAVTAALLVGRPGSATGADWAEVLSLTKRLLPFLIAFAVLQSVRIGERVFAADVASGGTAAFQLAFRVVSGSQTLLGMSVAVVGLSSEEAAGSDRRWRSRLGLVLGTSSVISVLVLGLLSVIDVGASPSLTLLADSARGLFPGLPAMTALPVVNARLLGLGKERIVLGGNVGLAVTNWSLLLVLVGPMGLAGLGFAFSAAAWLTLLALLALTKAVRMETGPGHTVGGGSRE
jgi:hypothetical protein